MAAADPFMPHDRQLRFIFAEQYAISKTAVTDIDWGLFDLDWTIESLQASILQLVESGSSVYIGVTLSPIWRWELSRSHETVKPHAQFYQKMFVLAFDHASCIAVVEELLIDRCRPFAGTALLNHKHYVPGPLRYYGGLFLYVCVR